MVNKLSIILFVIYALSFSQACAQNNQLFDDEALRISAGEEKTCAPPYKPDNIFTVTFNFSKGMEYISSAESACSEKFAQELVETFRDSFWISKGCLDATIKDVEEAKAKRKPPLPA